jgi:hypothetical protein
MGEASENRSIKELPERDRGRTTPATSGHEGEYGGRKLASA